MASYRVEIDGILDRDLADQLVAKLNPVALAEAGLTVRILENVPSDGGEAGD